MDLGNFLARDLGNTMVRCPAVIRTVPIGDLEPALSRCLAAHESQEGLYRGIRLEDGGFMGLPTNYNGLPGRGQELGS